MPFAARIEQIAKPGEGYITAATHALAGNRIEAQRIAPVSVKGISQPVPVFILGKVRSVNEVPIDVALSPLAGRKAALAQFSALLSTCLQAGYGQTVFIRGDPGIGKTRLGAGRRLRIRSGKLYAAGTGAMD